MIKNSETSYGSVAKFFHWTVSVLVILMLTFGYFMEDFSKEMQPLVYNIHKMTGITILGLVILRLLWALTNVKPAMPAGTPGWQILLERVGHFAFYIFLMVMPLAGWIGSAAAGRPPHLGGFDFNLPIQKDKILSGAAFDVHGTVAIILIVMIIGHVLAVLYHQFIKKDQILKRMLP